MESALSEVVPRDQDGNCAVCHQPIRELSGPKPARKRRSRLVITEPQGSEGAIEEKAFLLGERWAGVWPTMDPGIRGWLGRVIDFALQECLDRNIMPSEDGA